MPTFFNLCKSEIPETPEDMEKNTNGTIVIFNNLKNTVPIGCITVIFSLKINPAIAPNTNPNKI